MVITDKFAFLHLQKCGGSFIRNWILENISSSKFIKPQHEGFTLYKNQIGNKPIIGIIRNPWDWYVSLFHYNFESKGGILKPIFKENDNFESWLKRVMNKKNGRVHDLDFNWIGKFDVGPFSFRMIKCFNKSGLSIKNLSEINLNKINIIKLENLVPNIIKVLEENNIKLSEKQLKSLQSRKKENTSKRDSYKKYYTDELIELVTYKDRFIIENFNYEY